MPTDDRPDAKTTPCDDPLAGSPFRTLRPLGKGGTGTVVEAEHIALGKRVVVKLLHADLAQVPLLVDRMRLEAQALGRISPHPHVVEVLDVGTTQWGRPFIVMERLHGSTLREELDRRGHLSVDEALDICADLLAGLGAAHRVGSSIGTSSRQTSSSASRQDPAARGGS
jgi:eukaryotic-like serine/threonine-protein kinase